MPTPFRGSTQTITDDIHHPADTTAYSDDHQHAVDALRNGDCSHAHTLLDEARTAVERAQHDANSQACRETAGD